MRRVDDDPSPHGAPAGRVLYGRDDIERQLRREVGLRYPILHLVVSVVGVCAWVLLACGVVAAVLCWIWFLSSSFADRVSSLVGLCLGVGAALSGVGLGVAAEALRTLADIAVQTMPRSLTVFDADGSRSPPQPPQQPPSPPRPSDGRGIDPSLL